MEPKIATEEELRKIISWVLDYSDDQHAMDRLSLLIFPYTTKYKERNRPRRNEDGIHVSY